MVGWSIIEQKEGGVMSDTDVLKILLTAILTIIGGVIVFSLGQLVQRFLLEPAQEQAKAISEVCFRLIHYASWYANPGLRSTDDQNKQAQAAAKAIRECASRLQATTDVIYWYPLLCSIGVVPIRANVEEAIGNLIRISNSMDTGNGRVNSQDADKVYQLLVGKPRKIIPT
jgi:hypothetical protein